MTKVCGCSADSFAVLAGFRIIAPLGDNSHPFQMRTKKLICLLASKSPKFKFRETYRVQQAKGTSHPL